MQLTISGIYFIAVTIRKKKPISSQVAEWVAAIGSHTGGLSIPPHRKILVTLATWLFMMFPPKKTQGINLILNDWSFAVKFHDNYV